MKKPEKNSPLTKNPHATRTGYSLLREYAGIWLRIGLILVIGLLMSQHSYGQWTQLGFNIDGEAAGDQSGWSVSLSLDGNRLAIGARGNDGAGSDAGLVRVYAWNGTVWSRLGDDIDGEAAGDYSGESVSLSSDGSRLAIGAPGSNGGTGQVKVYAWNGTAWSQLGDDIDGEAAGDVSGVSVSLSSDGSRLAIGAPYNDGTSSNAGHVRVYEWNGTAWVQLGLDLDGEAVDDQFGVSVSLSSDGNRLAIGGNGRDTATGYVRVYAWDSTAWVQLGLDLDGEAAYNNFGFPVSLSSDGNRLAVGASGNNATGSNAGQVRVYAWDSTAWVQLGDDINGEAAEDFSGRSLSLSSDGSRLAIGAEANDGAGDNAGHVRVYEWDGTAWVQLGDDIDGEAAEDYSGYSVSLSSDGSRLAISTIGSNLSTGHVRVYEGFQRSEHTTPLPLMSSWQLLLCGLLLVSLSGIAFGNKAKRVV